MSIQFNEESVKRAADVISYRWAEIVSPDHPELFEEIVLEVIQEFFRS
jgi:hypothetical protein